MANLHWRFWAWEGLSHHAVDFYGSQDILISTFKRIGARIPRHRLRNFRFLDLSPVDSTRGAPKILQRVARICPSIDQVVIPICSKLRSDQVIDFLTSMPGLTSLKLSRTRKDICETILRRKMTRISALKLDCIDHIAVPKVLATNFPALTRVFISIFPENYNSYPILETSCNLILHCAKTIEQIQLFGMPMNHDAINFIGRNCASRLLEFEFSLAGLDGHDQDLAAIALSELRVKKVGLKSRGWLYPKAEAFRKKLEVLTEGKFKVEYVY